MAVQGTVSDFSEVSTTSRCHVMIEFRESEVG